MKYLKSLKWEMIIFSAGCIGLGLLLVLLPRTAQTIIGAALATLCFVYAIRHFIEYYRRFKAYDYYKYELVIGIILFVMGVVVLFQGDCLCNNKLYFFVVGVYIFDVTIK